MTCARGETAEISFGLSPIRYTLIVPIALMKPYWSGVFPAMITHMRPDESLDLKSTAEHIEILIDSGISGLIMLGSLGENQALHLQEKKRVLKLAKEVVAGRIPVLSGVAENSTSLACDYVHEGEKIGLDGFMLMPAMVYKGDAVEILAHFRTVARATSLPIMIYNNPVSYGNDITPEMLQALSSTKNFVALKESSGNPRRLTDLHNVVGDRYALFTGVDDLILESGVLGIDGWVAGIGVAFPKENQHLWNLIERKAWDRAKELNRWYTPLAHLDTYPKFVQYIKLAAQECGLGSEWVRSPRRTLSGKERQSILRVIRNGIQTRPKISAR